MCEAPTFIKLRLWRLGLTKDSVLTLDFMVVKDARQHESNHSMNLHALLYQPVKLHDQRHRIQSTAVLPGVEKSFIGCLTKTATKAG